MFETESNINVMSSTFVRNKALGKNGGAILCTECEKLHIRNRTSFVDNAADRGGALAVIRTFDALIENLTIVEGNTATEGGGGGLYWVEVEPVFYPNSTSLESGTRLWSDNSALYGNLYASAVELCRAYSDGGVHGTSVVQQQQQQQEQTVDHQSTIARNNETIPTIYVEVLDHYLNVAKAGNNTPITVTASSYNLTLAPLIGMTEVSINQKEGRATFDGLILAAMPGEYKLKFSVQLPLPLASPHADLAVNMLTCSEGYSLKSLTKGYRCEVCEPGRSKSSTVKGAQCVDCPIGFFAGNVGSAECSVCVAGKFASTKQTECSEPSEVSSLPALRREDVKFWRANDDSGDQTQNSSSQLVLSWVFPRIQNHNENEFIVIVQASHSPDFASRSNETEFKPVKSARVNQDSRRVFVSSHYALHEVVVYLRLALQKKSDMSMRGPWLALLKPWQTTSSCDEFEYLDDGADTQYPQDWTCEPCPNGASCSGNVRYDGVHALFGFWRVPGRAPHTFRKCLFPAACLGVANDELFGKYFNSSVHNKTTDLARRDHQEGCFELWGFAQTCTSGSRCRLCAACRPGFKRAGRARCKVCPQKAMNRFLLVLGVLSVIFGASKCMNEDRAITENFVDVSPKYVFYG